MTQQPTPCGSARPSHPFRGEESFFYTCDSAFLPEPAACPALPWSQSGLLSPMGLDLVVSPGTPPPQPQWPLTLSFDSTAYLVFLFSGLCLCLSLHLSPGLSGLPAGPLQSGVLIKPLSERPPARCPYSSHYLEGKCGPNTSATVKSTATGNHRFCGTKRA